METEVKIVLIIGMALTSMVGGCCYATNKEYVSAFEHGYEQEYVPNASAKLWVKARP